MTYIIDRDGKPLMPTKRGNMVRHLLKQGVAKVVRYEPFTVMILRDVGHRVQAVTLGVDVGSRHIGLSASTEKEELYSAQVELRDDVSGLLEERSKLRRGRRGRKHNWYRPARWENRAKGRGWAALPPSIRHKADSHVRAVRFVAKMLPICRIRVELGKFDIQKIQNPEIQGEQYQQGTLAGWENLKAYAKYRDGYKCRACGKSKHDDGVRLEVHHIIRKTDGGTDVPENVVTLCEACHKAHHQEAKKLKFRRPPQHKGEAHMNAMRHCLFEGIVWFFGHLDIKATYGYETAMARREHGIEKSHANDAFCIAGNFGAERNIYNVYLHKFVRRHNRKLHKTTITKGGIRKANQCAKEVFGYRLNDRVRYAGKDWFVHSRRTRGSFLLGNLTMTEKAEVSCRKIRLIHRVETLLTERRVRNSSQP